MHDLKRKIKYLDREISAEKSLLTQQTNVLFDYMHSGKFLIPAMIGGFALGFFIAHKPAALSAAKGKIRKIPAFVGTLIKNVQLVLPLLL